MSENAIPISNLNDFIFCPASIYFHALDADTEKLLYQDSFQLNGTAAHGSVDRGKYSTRKDILQSLNVSSEELDVTGKIDTLDLRTGVLTERKKKIRVVYDGYVFQLYAQCYALREMGYSVRQLRLYSISAIHGCLSSTNTTAFISSVSVHPAVWRSTAMRRTRIRSF